MILTGSEIVGLLEVFNLLHSNGIPVPDSVKELETAIPEYLENN